jgi:hypothetical protein
LFVSNDFLSNKLDEREKREYTQQLTIMDEYWCLASKYKMNYFVQIIVIVSKQNS